MIAILSCSICSASVFFIIIAACCIRAAKVHLQKDDAIRCIENCRTVTDVLAVSKAETER